MKSFVFIHIQQQAFRRTLVAVLASVGIVVLLAGAGVACATDAPDAKGILSHAAAVYQNLKSYQAKITVQTVDGPKVAEQQFNETGSGNAYRCEESEASGLIFASDGKTDWTLDRGADVYAKSASGTAPACLKQLAGIDQNVKDASVDDQELYWLNGTPVKTYIVEVTRTSWPGDSPAGAQSVTYTIDEQTFNVYKAITYTNAASQVALYTLTQIGEAPAASQFAFTPPASAKEVSSLPTRPLKYSSIVGMQASDFTLKDAAGHTYKLSDFKGKVVVLDFVGSWCPPCLAQMPYLQQENDSFPPSDLEVFGLDIGEDAKQATDFAQNGAYSFPLLLGAEPDVATAYFVADYPTTYIINRQGRIVFKSTGTENPGGFLSAVKAATAEKK
ncbi:MAG TPA: redoxin domain-containing protein [Candidatus Acidoferrales bacterium]